MKKILALLCAVLIGTAAFADVYILDNVNMKNFWEKNGKDVQKVNEIGRQIILANGLKRAPIDVYRVFRIKNAFSEAYNKEIHIYSGILPYFNNDDEAAYVIAHELAHSNEAYKGIFVITAMSLNKKHYEYKSDLFAIDYMVKAGYNPIAAIITANRIFSEPLCDWGFLASHPAGSKRMLKMYDYIYTKYPQYLNSEMTNAPEYISFKNQYSYKIKKIEQNRKARQLKQKEDI